MERHPITKCPETKYADEMIRTGFPIWQLFLGKDKLVQIENFYKKNLFSRLEILN